MGFRVLGGWRGLQAFVQGSLKCPVVKEESIHAILTSKGVRVGQKFHRRQAKVFLSSFPP